MATKTDIQEKTTKHHGSSKRPNRLEVSLSDEEWNKLEVLTREAGEKTVPKFARKLLLGGGTVVAAVSPEDRKEIAQLSKIGANLWQLRKDLNNYGVDDKMAKDLEAFRTEFAKVLLHFREKVDKK